MYNHCYTTALISTEINKSIGLKKEKKRVKLEQELFYGNTDMVQIIPILFLLHIRHHGNLV